MEPNDVDCVLLFQPGRRTEPAVFKELRKGLPFLDIGLAGPKRFDRYINRLFAEDRYGESKGMIEVVYDAAE
jgi:hypothetical protein